MKTVITDFLKALDSFKKCAKLHREALFVEELDQSEREKLAKAVPANECCQFNDEIK